MVMNIIRKIFLFNLFSGERDLKSINKYSVCQICKSEEELLDFLDIRDGKFYFNDSDIRALDIKNRFLNIEKNAFLKAN